MAIFFLIPAALAWLVFWIALGAGVALWLQFITLGIASVATGIGLMAVLLSGPHSR